MMMKVSVMLAALIMFVLIACAPGVQSSNEKVSDAEAQALYLNAVKEIIALASENPADVISKILGDVEIIYEDKSIDGKKYNKTTAAFQDLQEHYAKIFTGEALMWILSTKFADVDGVLYCSPIGGASGWSIENLKISLVHQSENQYIFNAKFNEFDKITSSQFTIVNTDNGYRISEISYIPELLKNK